jgi:hypothetical protein
VIEAWTLRPTESESVGLYPARLDGLENSLGTSAVIRCRMVRIGKLRL